MKQFYSTVQVQNIGFLTWLDGINANIDKLANANSNTIWHYFDDLSQQSMKIILMSERFWIQELYAGAGMFNFFWTRNTM